MNPPDPFDIAIAWISSALLGELATAVAMLAVAGIGFAMLQGQLSAREGIRVLLGCVILFNAPIIAKAFSDRTDETVVPYEAPPLVPHPPITVPPHSSVVYAPYDPYAGAAVPQ